MANCSFIGAVEARNIARNNTLIWEEICGIQTQILGAIDGNLYSVIVNDGTPMTSTQSILSVAVTNGGGGYTSLTATAVINDNGTAGNNTAVVVPVVTGTTVTEFTVTNGGSGYTPVSATASVRTPYNLNNGADTDYNGVGTEGTFSAGADYFPTDTITLSDSTIVTVVTIDATEQRYVLIDAQDETSYPNVYPAAGSFSAGSGYIVNEQVTLGDGTVINVDAAPGGVITQFTVDSTNATSADSTGNLRGQFSSNGSGAGFLLEPDTGNENIVGPVETFTVNAAGSTNFFLTNVLSQTSTVTAGTGPPIGTGFALTPNTGNATSVPHGGVAAVLTPIVTNGAVTSVVVNSGGTMYTDQNPIAINHPAGTGATAVANVIGGVIQTVDVITAGSGYQQAVATVTVTAPGGLTPALAFAGTVTTSGGVVTGVIVTEGGSGYAPLYPTITVSDPTGAGATFTTNIAGGLLTAVNVVTGGAGYSQTPTPTILNSNGTLNNSATLVFVVGTNTFNTVPSDYYDVLVGQSTNPVYADQIQYILDYFTSLGYNIRAQTNSATADTIQWQIIW